MKKNYKIILAILSLSVLTILVISYQIKSSEEILKFSDILKEEAALKKSGDRSATIVKGKNIQITEAEIALKVKTYELKGNEDPENAALKHLLERKVLLNKAIQSGYSVTEEELDQQIALVKTALKDADNNSYYESFITEYGSEDAYWNDIRETTKDTMIINMYLDHEKELFNEKSSATDANTVGIQTSEKLLEDWNHYKSEIIRNLITDENITILDDKFKDFTLFEE